MMQKLKYGRSVVMCRSQVCVSINYFSVCTESKSIELMSFICYFVRLSTMIYAGCVCITLFNGLWVE